MRGFAIPSMLRNVSQRQHTVAVSTAVSASTTRPKRPGLQTSVARPALKQLVPQVSRCKQLYAVAGSDNGVKDDAKELSEALDLDVQTEEISDGKKLVCEFVLQALFNFLSISSVAMAVKNSGGDAVVKSVQVMGAHAVILPLVIYAGLEISGSHFNPVVTACFVLAGKLSLRLGLLYVVAQLAGGVVGAAAALSSLPSSMQTLAHSGIQQVPATATIEQAFMGEVYAAFVFVFVLFSTNIDPRGWGKLRPFAIPLVICLLMWLVGPVSSLCINPARAFGPAVVTGFWEHHWIWWTAPFIGGLTAAGIYNSMFMPNTAK